MRIAILEAGFPPAPLRERFGTYGGMLAALIGDGFEPTLFNAQTGPLPADPAAFGGIVVTGSSAGIDDDLPWIAPLSSFLRLARGRTKLVGICFGHQLMAQAFGGRAERSDKGWGLGLHRYEVTERCGWMGEADAPSIAVAVSHQDQVTALPPGARVIGGSPFTPFGMLAYDAMSISFQCHPEFAPPYAKALLAHRHTARLLPPEFERLAASLDEPDDRQTVGRWIATFLRGEEAGPDR